MKKIIALAMLIGLCLPIAGHADSTLMNLPTAAPPAGSEYLYGVQGGADRKMGVDQLLSRLSSKDASGVLHPLPSFLAGAQADAMTAQAYADSVRRAVPAFAGDIVSAANCPTYTTDAGACLNYMLSKGKVGDHFIYPPAPGSPCIPWTTPVTGLTYQLELDFEVTTFCPSTSITLMTVAMPHGVIRGGQFLGNRTPGQTLLAVSGYQNVITKMDCQLMDVCWDQPQGSGFYNLYEHDTARSVATAVMHFEDGVGPIVIDLQYDTDGTWYNSSPSYPMPTNGCIWMQTEGMILSHTNGTHCGDGLRIEANSYRHIEWLLADGTNYFDSGLTSGSGVHIINNQTGNKPGTTTPIHIRGLFLGAMWSATNLRGLWIQGSGQIDGVFIKGGELHNNLDEGVRIDAPFATNVFLDGSLLAGNNAGGQGANNFYTNTAGNVGCKDCRLGRFLQWTTNVYEQVFADSNQSGSVDLRGATLDVSGTTNGAIYKSPTATGPVDIRNTEGVIAANRGGAIIAAGQTSVTVNPGLNVPYGLPNILVSPQGPTAAYPGNLNAQNGTFTISIPSALSNPINITWDVRVDTL